MAKIIGTNGNDTLEGIGNSDNINGKAGNDTIIASWGNNTLTGGGGNDKFVYKDDYYYDKTDIITDFRRVAKGTNSTAAVIAEVDTLIFESDRFTVQNLLLAQNAKDLEITFEKEYPPKVILRNFALQNLNNPSLSTGATFGLGNVEFGNQTSISKSFDVFNANSIQSTIFTKNTATFLNELNNNVSGFDNSNDVINGQGGNDKIDGKSGNDILRGSVGNDTLIGGAGNDTLKGYTGIDSLLGGIGDDRLYVDPSSSNNFLSGGDGNDLLNTDGYDRDSYYPDNIIGGAGDDTLSAQYLRDPLYFFYLADKINASDNNTLIGGAGNDTLYARSSSGYNLLSSGDGNDFLDTSSYSLSYDDNTSSKSLIPSSGNNTLNGGAGDDRLYARFSLGNNLLSGGDGNDFFDLSNIVADSTRDFSPTSLVTETVDGGIGDDVLTLSYDNPTQGIRTTFNATDNIGSITSGTNRVSYKNIEGLNISGTYYDDLIVGSNSNDTINDTMFSYYSGNDTIDGGIGDDLLIANLIDPTEAITTTFNATTNIGSINWGTKNQISYKNIERLNISGTQYDDLIVGSNGNDTIDVSGRGDDTIDGGIGDDLLTVSFNRDYRTRYTKGITTTFNATTNIGSITDDTKNQVSYKNIERLNISGTGNDDFIVGSNGNDTLYGGYYGNDTLIGGDGNDNLYGEDGNDTLIGGDGNDNLYGENGNDTLYGGAGNDIFAFSRFYYLNTGIDTFYDFNPTNDLIQIKANYFGPSFPIGSLAATRFTIGTSATTSTQRIIYNNITGALYIDQDGSGRAFTQVQFAQLEGGVSLTEKNFVVV
ncbi:calcium-binding protein [Nostoc sp. CHAB 5836]|uniref:calcium-binding protein n=1 Tax=Nostoc sp. CHAB 5836 TaxID=2780404 RepID=UPI00226EFC29|nr:calcium-binding protein [Nostoc sp. CHAB 5836]